MLWPHIDSEYQQELQGIADGVKAHGIDLDVWTSSRSMLSKKFPTTTSMAQQTAKDCKESQARSARKLQRFYCDRQHDEGS